MMINSSFSLFSVGSRNVYFIVTWNEVEIAEKNDMKNVIKREKLEFYQKRGKSEER